jgi:hypothetical protein
MQSEHRWFSSRLQKFEFRIAPSCQSYDMVGKHIKDRGVASRNFCPFATGRKPAKYCPFGRRMASSAKPEHTVEQTVERRLS